MRQVALVVGIVCALGTAWVVKVSTLAFELAWFPASWGATLRSSAEILLALPLGMAGLMFATLVVAWWRSHRPGASPAMKMLAVACTCAGVLGAAGVVSSFGPSGLLGPRGGFLIVWLVPLAVSLTLSSANRRVWTFALVLMTLGVAGGARTAVEWIISRPAAACGETTITPRAKPHFKRPSVKPYHVGEWDPVRGAWGPCDCFSRKDEGY